MLGHTHENIMLGHTHDNLIILGHTHDNFMLGHTHDNLIILGHTHDNLIILGHTHDNLIMLDHTCSVYYLPAASGLLIFSTSILSSKISAQETLSLMLQNNQYCRVSGVMAIN